MAQIQAGRYYKIFENVLRESFGQQKEGEKLQQLAFLLHQMAEFYSGHKKHYILKFYLASSAF